MWNKDQSTDYMNCSWNAGTDFPLRDRFAMQYMDRQLESFFRDGFTLNAADLDRRLQGMWRDAYVNADLAMQAREPKKKVSNA